MSAARKPKSRDAGKAPAQEAGTAPTPQTVKLENTGERRGEGPRNLQARADYFLRRRGSTKA